MKDCSVPIVYIEDNKALRTDYSSVIYNSNEKSVASSAPATMILAFIYILLFNILSVSRRFVKGGNFDGVGNDMQKFSL